VHGDLRLRVYSGDPALLLRRPPICVRTGDGKVTAARLVAVRPVDRALLARLEGVDDRDAAEALRGAEVLVDRSEFAPLEGGELYASALERERAELVTRYAADT